MTVKLLVVGGIFRYGQTDGQTNQNLSNDSTNNDTKVYVNYVLKADLEKLYYPKTKKPLDSNYRQNRGTP